MTLSEPDLRLLAWQGPFDPCATCGQTQSHRCRTASGNLTTPHAPRIAVARGYDARQPEVDALLAQVASLRASNDQLVAALKTSDDKLDMALQRLANLQLDLTHAQQELADYKATHPDVPPPAPTDPPGWKPLLVENFDTLDTKVWDVKDRYVMGGRDDVSMAANVSIVDGKLRLWMKKQAATATTGETRQITTGNVWLRQKLPNEHRLEFTVTVPWQNGCWPGSIWETGSNKGAEMDLYEVFPLKRPNAKTTLHSRPYGADHILEGNFHAAPSLTGPVKVVMEKRATSVKVWWNDVLVDTYDPTSRGWDAAYWEDPAQVWTVWINLQSGGTGGKVDASTDWSKTYMDVESVKVWVPA